MNRIIRVYGHHRSGNNYLSALMWKNFYSGMDSVSTEIDRNGRPFILFGELVKDDPFTWPYGKIWGSHDPREVTQDSIYIVRNREDVMRSVKKLKRPILLEFDHWMHIYIAIQNMPYIVYYEILKEHPEKVLGDIQHYFGLVRLFKNFIVDVGYCGWAE